MDEITNVVIGAKLRELRLKAGLSQSELASRYGTHQSFISKIELGKRSLTLGESLPYALALGMSDELMYHEVRHAIVSYAKKVQQARQEQATMAQAHDDARAHDD